MQACNHFRRQSSEESPCRLGSIGAGERQGLLFSSLGGRYECYCLENNGSQACEQKEKSARKNAVERINIAIVQAEAENNTRCLPITNYESTTLCAVNPIIWRGAPHDRTIRQPPRELGQGRQAQELPAQKPHATGGRYRARTPTIEAPTSPIIAKTMTPKLSLLRLL